MTIVIEQAGPADLSAVLDLTMEHAKFNEGFDPAYYSLTENAENEYKDTLWSALRDRHQAILVAKSGEDIVGCIQADMRRILVFRRGERGLIYNLYVKRMWRRRGIGRQLMDEAISWVRNKGGEIVFLNVATENEEAQQFYDKLGFKTVNANMYKLI